MVLAMLVMSVSLSAQKKGEMYIQGSFGLSGGDRNSISTSNGSTTTRKDPLALSFNIAPEFGYFVCDNLKISLSLSYKLQRTPNGNDDDIKLYKFDNDFYITPNVSYYLKITDKFFYTPGVDIFVGYGNSVAQTSATEKTKSGSETSFGFRFKIASLEYRLSSRLAFTANFGDFNFTTITEKEDKTNKRVTNLAGLDLKPFTTSLGIKCYF